MGQAYWFRAKRLTESKYLISWVASRIGRGGVMNEVEYTRMTDRQGAERFARRHGANVWDWKGEDETNQPARLARAIEE